MSGHYEVVFSGEVYASVDPVKVRSDMARIFRQPAEKVHRLFDGRSWVLKDGLDRATAERYQVELAKIGIISELRDRAPKYETSRPTDPFSKSQNFTLEAVAVTRMQCPDCDYQQLDADYCARCGVSIAVARAKAKARASDDVVIQARIRQLRERPAPPVPPVNAAGDDAQDGIRPDPVIPRRPVQETTAEFRGAAVRRGPSPLIWILGTLLVLGAGLALAVRQGIVVLQL